MKCLNLLACTALAVLAATPAFAASEGGAGGRPVLWLILGVITIGGGYLTYLLATAPSIDTVAVAKAEEEKRRRDEDVGSASICRGADACVVPATSAHATGAHAIDGGSSAGGSSGGPSCGSGSSCGGSSCGGGGGGCGGGD